MVLHSPRTGAGGPHDTARQPPPPAGGSRVTGRGAEAAAGRGSWGEPPAAAGPGSAASRAPPRLREGWRGRGMGRPAADPRWGQSSPIPGLLPPRRVEPGRWPAAPDPQPPAGFEHCFVCSQSALPAAGAWCQVWSGNFTGDEGLSRAWPEFVWRWGRCCTPDGCEALHCHCDLSGGSQTPSFCCPRNHHKNGVKYSGDKGLQSRGESQHGQEATAQQTWWFGHDCLLPPHSTISYARRLWASIGLLVFSWLKVDGRFQHLKLPLENQGEKYTHHFLLLYPALHPSSHHCKLTSQSCLHLTQVTSQMNGKPFWSANAFVWRECGSTPVLCIWIREWEDKSYKPQEIQHSSRVVRGWLQVPVWLHCSTYQCRDAFQLLVLFVKNWESKRQIQIKSWSLFHRDLRKLLKHEACK